MDIADVLSPYLSKPNFRPQLQEYTIIMKRLYLILIIGIAALLGARQVNAAATPARDGIIKGRVTDPDGHPLQAVNVGLPQINKGAVTDASGRYEIHNIPAGTYTLIFSMIGYSKATLRVEVEAGQTQTINQVLKKTVLEAETVTVTGSAYASDPLNTAADVDALGGRTKLSEQSASLGATLEDMPGVTNISTGSQVGKPVIRGLSGNRVRVMSDGTPMDFQQFGVRHMPNVDPLLSQRIEVVRGASSVLYGSDALGGAVNVLPNKIPTPTGSHARVVGRVYGSYATNNLERMGALHLQGVHGGFGWTGTLVRRFSGNLRTPSAPTYLESGVSTDPKFTGTLDHTDFSQLNGQLGLGYTADYGKIDAHYTRWSNEQNFLLPDGSGEGQRLSNDNLELSGLYSRIPGVLVHGKFTYTHNMRKAGEPGTTRKELNDQTVALNLTIDSYTGRVEIEHSPIGILSGKAGAEYMHQDQNTLGSELLVPPARIDNIGFFAFEEASLGRLKLSAGARFDVRTQREEPTILYMPVPNAASVGDNLRQRYHAFSGSVGATYRLTDKLALAANIGRGFRAPSVFELHVDGVHGGVAAYQVGDSNLKEELSLNTDLSLRWRSEKLHAKVTVYRNVIDNYIYLRETDQVRDGFAVWNTTQGNAMLLGGDASFQAQPLSWLQLRGSFETVKGTNRDADEDLPMLPATKTSGEVRFTRALLGPAEQLYLGVKVSHSASKNAAGAYEPFSQFDSMPFGTASTGAYTLADLNLGFELPLFGHRADFTVQVKNLFNETYRDFLDTYKGYALGTGRNLIMKVSVPFDVVK